jgi:hypothetical protein
MTLVTQRVKGRVESEGKLWAVTEKASGEASRRRRAITMLDVADQVGVSKVLVSMVFRANCRA